MRQAALRDWWKQFNDPVLLELIDAAQAASPSIAAAASRIEQARASSVAAGALLLPGAECQRLRHHRAQRPGHAAGQLRLGQPAGQLGARPVRRQPGRARRRAGAAAGHAGRLARRAHRRRRRDGGQLQRAARLRGAWSCRPRPTRARAPRPRASPSSPPRPGCSRRPAPRWRAPARHRAAACWPGSRRSASCCSSRWWR